MQLPRSVFKDQPLLHSMNQQQVNNIASELPCHDSISAIEIPTIAISKWLIRARILTWLRTKRHQCSPALSRRNEDDYFSSSLSGPSSSIDRWAWMHVPQSAEDVWHDMVMDWIKPSPQDNVLLAHICLWAFIMARRNLENHFWTSWLPFP